MTSFPNTLAAERRRDILRILADQAGYPVNGQIMQKALTGAGWRHAVSLDEVHGDYDWLAAQGLIATEKLTPTLVTATVTARGVDVAKGYAAVTGVARPDGRG